MITSKNHILIIIYSTVTDKMCAVGTSWLALVQLLTVTHNIGLHNIHTVSCMCVCARIQLVAHKE